MHKTINLGRATSFGVALLAGFALSACGEKPQEISKSGPGSTVTRDTKAYSGDGGKYAASGLKAGDKAVWETQLKQRMQAQDEYNRAK